VKTKLTTKRHILCLAAATVLAACAAPPATAPAPSRTAAAAELTPTGTLRAAINFGNPILASRGPGGAIDPVRAADMEYTAPYVIIEGAYLVRQGSPLRSNAEVDRSGTRVAVGRGSAYDLFLTRELKAATILRAPTSPEVTDFFLAQNLDVAAGVKQQLEADARRVGGVRLLPGRFMVIEQAMGVPKGRRAAQEWLSSFIEEMKSAGFVAAALQRHGIEGAAVAPPRAAR
jgi:polar amino acid transport system substrate-binding protein